MYLLGGTKWILKQNFSFVSSKKINLFRYSLYSILTSSCLFCLPVRVSVHFHFLFRSTPFVLSWILSPFLSFFYLFINLTFVHSFIFSQSFHCVTTLQAGHPRNRSVLVRGRRFIYSAKRLGCRHVPSASYSVVTAGEGAYAWNWPLTLVSRLGLNGATDPLPCTPSWHSHGHFLFSPERETSRATRGLRTTVRD